VGVNDEVPWCSCINATATPRTIGLFVVALDTEREDHAFVYLIDLTVIVMIVCDIAGITLIEIVTATTPKYLHIIRHSNEQLRNFFNSLFWINHGYLNPGQLRQFWSTRALIIVAAQAKKVSVRLAVDSRHWVSRDQVRRQVVVVQRNANLIASIVVFANIRQSLSTGLESPALHPVDGLESQR